MIQYRSKITGFLSNNKHLLSNIVLTGVVNVLSVSVAFLTTPAYMKYFENETILGIWFTIISVLDAMSLMDLGLGAGLRNRLSVSFAELDDNKSKKIISSAYFIITLINVFILLIGNLIIPCINWNQVLSINPWVISANYLLKSIRLVFFAVILQLALKLISSILFAMQKAAAATLLPVCTNILMLLYVMIAPSSDSSNNLISLSRFYCVAANLPYLVTTIYIFCGKNKKYRPKIGAVNLNVSVDIIKLGLLFFYLTLMSMITHNTNEILISTLYEPAIVVEYQIYNKIFSLITVVMNIIMVPIWSASTKALAEQRYKWLQNLHTILCSLSVMAFIAGLLLIPIMQFIVNVWLGESAITINVFYCIPFVIFVAENTFNGANATVANGCNWIKVQLIMSPVSAVLKILFTIIFKQYIDNWTAIILANIFSLLPIAIIQYIYIRKKLRDMKNKAVLLS